MRRQRTGPPDGGPVHSKPGETTVTKSLEQKDRVSAPERLFERWLRDPKAYHCPTAAITASLSAKHRQEQAERMEKLRTRPLDGRRWGPPSNGWMAASRRSKEAKVASAPVPAESAEPMDGVQS